MTQIVQSIMLSIRFVNGYHLFVGQYYKHPYFEPLEPLLRITFTVRGGGGRAIERICLLVLTFIWPSVIITESQKAIFEKQLELSS